MLHGKEEKPQGFVFTTRHMANPTGNGDLIRRQGANVSGLAGSYVTIDSIVQSSGWGTNDSVKSTSKSVDERGEVEPKQVFDEIKRETPDISFDNLDERIEAVEERIEILKEHLDESHLGDEHRALFYLKNRRKYVETRKKLPIDWAMTTSEAIDDLCKRYKLKIVPLKQFYTLVPKEGIKEMDRYTKAYQAITGDKPIFELVVKDTQPAAEERRKKDRDPILLANSPLGNHLFILGVWDEEVAIVDEIIYGFK